MKDASHSDPLGNQGIILLHGLLRLEDPHINALFLEVLHSGWRHLERRERDEQEGGKGPQGLLSCPEASVHRIRAPVPPQSPRVSPLQHRAGSPSELQKSLRGAGVTVVQSVCMRVAEFTPQYQDGKNRPLSHVTGLSPGEKKWGGVQHFD